MHIGGIMVEELENTQEQAPVEINAEYMEKAQEQPVEQADEKIEAPEGDLGNKGDGHKQVPMDGEVLERFNRLYRQVKGQDNTLKRLRDHNQQMQDRLDASDQKQKENEHQATVDGIHSQIQHANEDGDYEAVPALISKLVTAETSKQTPITPIKQEQTGGLTDTDIQTISDWQSDRSREGNYTRPWAQPDHPLHKHVQGITMSVIDHPNFEGASMEQVLSGVDSIIAAELKTNINRTKQTTVAAVSSSDTSYRPDGNRTGVNALTREEKATAELMLPNLSVKDAHKLYALQKE